METLASQQFGTKVLIDTNNNEKPVSLLDQNTVKAEDITSYQNMLLARAQKNETALTKKLDYLLGKMGYFERGESKKFAMIITAILVSTLALGIGLTMHYVGVDKMLHWFQGDFTSWFKDHLSNWFKNDMPNWFENDMSNWFKNDFVTWITNHADALKFAADGVGGVALGILLYLAYPKIKEKAHVAFEALKALKSEAPEDPKPNQVPQEKKESEVDDE